MKKRKSRKAKPEPIADFMAKLSNRLSKQSPAPSPAPKRDSCCETMQREHFWTRMEVEGGDVTVGASAKGDENEYIICVRLPGGPCQHIRCSGLGLMAIFERGARVIRAGHEGPKA